MIHSARRRFIGIVAASSALALAPSLLRRAHAAIAPTSWQGVALGADAELRLYHPDRQAAERLIERALRELRRLEGVFSLYREDSALSILNRQGYLVDPPSDLVRLLSESRHYAALTGGLFDPTVQPLWRVYADHFSRPDAAPHGPAQAAVAQALKHVSYKAVNVDTQRIQLRPGMAVTLNGIAQGYITDRVTELLRDAGLERALIDMGEIRGLDAAAGATGWRVGLADPLAPDQILAQVPVNNQALATSGGYGTPLDAAGRFSHLFDPRSGHARPLYRSVSVMASTATAADALSTAFSNMPLKDTAAVVRSLGVSAWMVLPDGRLVTQTGGS
ncbi:FAD:protein FMN transferase [Achromobacter arsenitoxydans]|uniref:FAD:protein FMN transferase n=1 Tax=Achromobacter arsenitoxydans SY8 TaxID=477184 RepID=H0FBQ0_9BURK|nr:FAD:protein FMN transferase [Achromobacter arsenitoxydans]EHK64317.1 ApbE family protein 2 [Achromobacter arsenitoxydans SY8]